LRGQKNPSGTGRRVKESENSTGKINACNTNQLEADFSKKQKRDKEMWGRGGMAGVDRNLPGQKKKINLSDSKVGKLHKTHGKNRTLQDVMTGCPRAASRGGG